MQRKPSGLMTQPSEALSELNLGGGSPGSPKRTSAAPPWMQDLEEGNEDDDAVSVVCIHTCLFVFKTHLGAIFVSFYSRHAPTLLFCFIM